MLPRKPLKKTGTFYDSENIKISNGCLSASEVPQVLLKEVVLPGLNHRVGKVLKTDIFLKKAETFSQRNT